MPHRDRRAKQPANAAQRPQQVPAGSSHDLPTTSAPNVTLQAGGAAKAKGEGTNQAVEGGQKVESVSEQPPENAEASQYHASDRGSVVTVDFVDEDPRRPESSLFLVSVPHSGGIYPGPFELIPGDRFECDSVSMVFGRGGKQSTVSLIGAGRDRTALGLALVADYTAPSDLAPPSCLSMSSQQTEGSKETVPDSSAKST